MWAEPAEPPFCFLSALRCSPVERLLQKDQLFFAKNCSGSLVRYTEKCLESIVSVLGSARRDLDDLAGRFQPCDFMTCCCFDSAPFLAAISLLSAQADCRCPEHS